MDARLTPDTKKVLLMLLKDYVNRINLIDQLDDKSDIIVYTWEIEMWNPTSVSIRPYEFLKKPHETTEDMVTYYNSNEEFNKHMLYVIAVILQPVIFPDKVDVILSRNPIDMISLMRW